MNRKLHTLMTVLRHGSFSAAAAELNCTQPAVSQTMNALEDELGVKILERGHRGVGLNDAGKKLLPFLIDADSALDRLIKEAARLAEGSQKLIRIAAFSSICNTILPELIAAYRKKHPDTAFELRTASARLPALLKTGEADIVLGMPERGDDCRWKTLFDDPFCAVLPSGRGPARQSVTADELRSENFIAAPLLAGLIAALGIPSKRLITVTAEDDTTVLQMIAGGLGVTAMPRLSLSALPPGVDVVPLTPPMSREIAFALPPHPTPEARRFAAFLLAQLRTRTHARTHPRKNRDNP